MRIRLKGIDFNNIKNGGCKGILKQKNAALQSGRVKLTIKNKKLRGQMKYTQ